MDLDEIFGVDGL